MDWVLPMLWTEPISGLVIVYFDWVIWLMEWIFVWIDYGYFYPSVI